MLKITALFATSFAGLVACADANAPIDTQSAALTAEQCSYFSVNGKITICHATSSTKNPYTIIRTDEEGCANGHEAHAGDYVAYNDPTCSGLGCFPEGAPFDGSVECCEGLEGRDGTCVRADLCYGVVCAPDQCEAGGKCDPKSGECFFELEPMKGKPCSDDDACTGEDRCDGMGGCMPGEAIERCGVVACEDLSQQAGDKAYYGCMTEKGDNVACSAFASEVFKKTYSETQCTAVTCSECPPSPAKCSQICGPVQWQAPMSEEAPAAE